MAIPAFNTFLKKRWMVLIEMISKFSIDTQHLIYLFSLSIWPILRGQALKKKKKNSYRLLIPYKSKNLIIENQ